MLQPDSPCPLCQFPQADPTGHRKTVSRLGSRPQCPWARWQPVRCQGGTSKGKRQHPEFTARLPRFPQDKVACMALCHTQPAHHIPLIRPDRYFTWAVEASPLSNHPNWLSPQYRSSTMHPVILGVASQSGDQRFAVDAACLVSRWWCGWVADTALQAPGVTQHPLLCCCRGNLAAPTSMLAAEGVDSDRSSGQPWPERGRCDSRKTCHDRFQLYVYDICGVCAIQKVERAPRWLGGRRGVDVPRPGRCWELTLSDPSLWLQIYERV